MATGLAACATRTDLERRKSATPKTKDAVVAEIVANLDEESLRTLRSTKEEDLFQFYIGWGTGIRNRYLWHGSDALLRSVCGGQLCHPEVASSIIMEDVWRRVNSSSDAGT